MKSALLFLLAAAPAFAQSTPPSRADSQLVARILSAEDRRDGADLALPEGARANDPRIRTIALRAAERIRDPHFLKRDSLPALPAPTAWPEPAWRLRYRALNAHKTDCNAIRDALSDSSWHVRLRAADLVTPACASDSVITSTLLAWIDSLPRDVSRRAAGGVSWHAAAHAIVALAQVAPDTARRRLPRLATNREWHLRMYAARAEADLREPATLRLLAHDPNDNVREASIVALRSLQGHDEDDTFLAALRSRGPQAVRAAAVALKGSPRPGVADSALATYARWAQHDVDSERDVRVALLEAAGRPTASEDSIHHEAIPVPRDAVALALGRDVRLRVIMSDASGGGSFVVRLRGDVAPIMAARVLALARTHYYDGGNWHRVEPDFVIQGGGPGTNEYVGYARYFRDELGTVPHARGTLGMSTRGHDSGDAQWFVNLKDNLRLNGDYSVFAEVVEGMDVVDGILEGDVIARVREERH